MSAWQELGRLALRGGGGEPVDWRRTLLSHGVAMLPPNRVDEERATLETTVDDPQLGVCGLRLHQPDGDTVWVEVDQELPPASAARVLQRCRQLLRLDEDLSPFYRMAERDAELAWVCAGAGRMVRSPTVFEDVVKTICTTNCAWSATERMVGALVTELGRPDGAGHRAFPTPEAMAAAGDDFYRDRARSGYRGAYLRSLAVATASGELDLEQLAQPRVSDAEAERQLLGLPGVGPYAAAHIMLTSLGRYRLLVLDSWTRPTYGRLSGRKPTDREIHRRFRRYRQFRGLAFWLYVTREWV